MDLRTLAQASLFKESFIQINRALLRALKGDAYSAIVLGELVSKYNYFKEKGDLQDEWFFQTVIDLEKSIGIDDYLQRKSIKSLVKKGFIKTSRRGNPPRRYFYIDFEEIYHVALEGKPIKNFKPNSNNKKAFYEELNRAVYSTIADFDKALDNIPAELGGLMFAWSRLYYTKGYGKWKWDSSEFGKLNNYWKLSYKGRKPFNYKSIHNYFMGYPSEPTIYDFLNYDRSQAEGLGINNLFQMKIMFPEIYGDIEKEVDNGKKEE
jgi:hypothetical protein